MADIPDLDALVEAGYEVSHADISADDVRAILTAVLPLVVGPAEESLDGITNQYVKFVESGDGGEWNPEEDGPVIRARNTLSQLKALDEARYPTTVIAQSVRFCVSNGIDARDEVPPQFKGIFEAHTARTRGLGSPALCDAALQLALKENTHA